MRVGQKYVRCDNSGPLLCQSFGLTSRYRESMSSLLRIMLIESESSCFVITGTMRCYHKKKKHRDLSDKQEGNYACTDPTLPPIILIPISQLQTINWYRAGDNAPSSIYTYLLNPTHCIITDRLHQHPYPPSRSVWHETLTILFFIKWNYAYPSLKKKKKRRSRKEQIVGLRTILKKSERV